MIRKLSDFNMYVAIAGYKNARISDVDKFFNTTREKLTELDAVQFFNADLIATWQHLYFAAVNALTAFANKTNISNNLAMETLLYASAQRQIKKATEMIGITPGTKNIAVLVLSKNREFAEKALTTVQKLTNAEPDDGVLEINQKKFDGIRRFFKISNTELASKVESKGREREALVDLVIEHGALLAAQR